jgi:hypothetical protein
MSILPQIFPSTRNSRKALSIIAGIFVSVISAGSSHAQIGSGSTKVTYLKQSLWGDPTVTLSIDGQSILYTIAGGKNKATNRDEVWGTATLIGGTFQPYTTSNNRDLVCRYYTDSAGTQHLHWHQTLGLTTDSAGNRVVDFKGHTHYRNLSTLDNRDPDGNGSRHRSLADIASSNSLFVPPNAIRDSQNNTWTLVGSSRNVFSSMETSGDGMEGFRAVSWTYRRIVNSATVTRRIFAVLATDNLYRTTDYHFSGWMSFERSDEFLRLLRTYQEAARLAYEETRYNLAANTLSVASILGAGVLSGYSWHQSSNQTWTSVANGAALTSSTICGTLILAGQRRAAILAARNNLFQARLGILHFVRSNYPGSYAVAPDF